MEDAIAKAKVLVVTYKKKPWYVSYSIGMHYDRTYCIHINLRHLGSMKEGLIDTYNIPNKFKGLFVYPRVVTPNLYKKQ